MVYILDEKERWQGTYDSSKDKKQIDPCTTANGLCTKAQFQKQNTAVGRDWSWMGSHNSLRHPGQCRTAKKKPNANGLKIRNYRMQ